MKLFRIKEVDASDGYMVNDVIAFTLNGSGIHGHEAGAGRYDFLLGRLPEPGVSHECGR